MKKLIVVFMLFTLGKNSNAQQTNQALKQKDSLITFPDTSMKEYVSMQAGQMLLVQKNSVGRMKQDMTMKNGTVVKTNGMVKTNDGRTFLLKEGDRVYLNGIIEGLGKPSINK